MKNILQLLNIKELRDNYPKAWEAFVSIDRTLDELKQSIDNLITNKTLYCRAFNDADLVIPTGGAGTLLTFNKTINQNSNFHDNVNSPGLFQISKEGWYTIGTSVRWAGNVTGQRVLRIRLTRGGVTSSIGIDFITQPSTNPALNTATTGMYLFPRDILFAEAFQDSGGNLNIQTVADYSPLFWLQRNV